MSEEIKEPHTDIEEPLEQQSKTECQSEIPSEEVATENLSEGTPSPESEEERLRTELDKLRDTHLRLVAEYDNYRKRTLKEKSELIRSGGEKVLGDLLPVVDDLDIALQNLDKATVRVYAPSRRQDRTSTMNSMRPSLPSPPQTRHRRARSSTASRRAIHSTIRYCATPLSSSASNP